MGTEVRDVVIIGAGPYGLASAAHLRGVGVEPYVFGEAMEFWQQQMPEGMLLRSSWDASHISDPQGALSLNAYQYAHALRLPSRLPLKDFIAYGQWFQRQVVPDLDRRRVKTVERDGQGFRMEISDGETMRARRVVVAGGIAPFAWRPAQFERLPSSLVSHSSEHRDLSMFAGRRVAVIGGGQSAVETAVLLGECGAEVELIMRAPALRWLRRSGKLHKSNGLVKRMLYAPSDVGPAGLSWLVALPDLFRQLPHSAQDRIAYRCIRPAASDWLMPRIGNVRMTVDGSVVLASADARFDNVRLVLDDGTSRTVDHVMLGTGYRVDITRYPFLGAGLVQTVKTVNGYPVLSEGFESSVPGLHFMGAPAAWSYGPVMRFVAGTVYSAPRLAQRVGSGEPGRTHGRST